MPCAHVILSLFDKYAVHDCTLNEPMLRNSINNNNVSFESQCTGMSNNYFILSTIRGGSIQYSWGRGLS